MTPWYLQEGASVRQQAIPILHELARNASVFFITHVIDDVGEATVRGALEESGLVGSADGQIKSHRLVFCSTLEGKVSIVRQQMYCMHDVLWNQCVKSVHEFHAMH